MDFKLIIPRSMSFVNCPECNSSGSLDRVRNDDLWSQILLKVFQVRGYHCRICKYEGRFFLYKIKNNPLRIILNYVLLIVILFVVLLVANIILKK